MFIQLKKNRNNIYVLLLIEAASEELKITKSSTVSVANSTESVRVKSNAHSRFVPHTSVTSGGRFVGRINVGRNLGS